MYEVPRGAGPHHQPWRVLPLVPPEGLQELSRVRHQRRLQLDLHRLPQADVSITVNIPQGL